MHIFLLGAGHVGLVTAVGFARLGHTVTVADIDEPRIAGLRSGRMPLYEPGLEAAIAEAGDKLSFTTDLRPPDDVRHAFVAVNTPQGPDGPLSTEHVEVAVSGLLTSLRGDQAIVVRSTLPLSGPDTLERLRGDRPDAPAIVTNPEFMREGSALRDFAQPGRIVAGWLAERDKAAAEAMLELYAGIDAQTLVANARTVALVKLASNGFLALKVAYANELARLADAFGADAQIVADGMGMDQRIGRSFLDAGPGFGGSCLPEQAVALSSLAGAAGVPAPVLDAVAVANDAHQRAIVARLAGLLDTDAVPVEPAASGGRLPLAGRRIALLGLAFKANTDDVRESPALALAALLGEAGATVVATDPRASERARRVAPDLAIASTPEAAAAGADAILVATEWAEYRSIDWAACARALRGDLVFDLRGVVDRAAAERAGLRTVALGRP
ncbi:MAG: UDP-glucose/GDP-mannose dehydrogenase family protein [Chloroflexi bacterium]|nr:UDP-glucose/GDP-mannose dehydrogenase family protein [Chloroflexota bacterium]